MKNSPDLVKNPKNVSFKCPTCKFYDAGYCGHPDKRIHGKKVGPQYCCNYYEHRGMHTVVK